MAPTRPRRKQRKQRKQHSASTHIDDIFRDSVQRGARRSALALLAKVRDARDRLDDLNDKEALHDFRVALRRLRSWLRAFRPALCDTVGDKVERRLKRIARATGSSRDLQVHVQWVASSRKTLSDQARVGATWLLKRLRQDKREADADFRRVIDAKFDRAAHDAEDALLRYEASVMDDGERFASVAADMIELQAEALSNAVERVTGQGDRAEAHATRIAAKRLRYLLEGVDDASASVHPLIDELKDLQDTLGELHDSQLFGGELATMIAELLADEGDTAKSSGNGGPAQERKKNPSPVAGLRVLSRRMRQAETTTFQKYTSTWSADATAGFTRRISSVAAELRAIGAPTASKKLAGSPTKPVRRRPAKAGR